MANTVKKCGDINFNKMVFENFIMANDDKHLISKIWYQESELIQPTSFYVQTSNLKLHTVPKTANDDLLLIVDNPNFFDELDKVSVNFIKSTGILKKYGLQKTTFKSNLSNPDNNSNLESLRLKIGNCDFYQRNKLLGKINDVLNLGVLQKDINVKAIIEIDFITINVKQNFIFTNLVIKQAQIQKLSPKKIELTEYSFIDDDLDDDINQDTHSDIKMEELMLNTQTEYMEDNNTELKSISSSDDKPVDKPTVKPIVKPTKKPTNKPVKKTKIVNLLKEVVSEKSNKSNSSNSSNNSDHSDHSDYTENTDNTDNSNSEFGMDSNSSDSADVAELIKQITEVNMNKKTL